MAGFTKFVCVVFFVSLMSKGTLQLCMPGELTVSQVPTGAKVANKAEWKVTVANSCPCTRLHVELYCAGFQTVESVDPKILTKSGDICIVNDDAPIYGNTSVSFTYAWDKPVPFRIFSFTDACSQ